MKRYVIHCMIHDPTHWAKYMEKESDRMLFFLICCLVILVLAIILFAWGRKNSRNGHMIAGFVLVVILACALALAQFSPTKYETMKIVHINPSTNVLTLIDDDGKAYYVDTDDTAHMGEFTVNSEICVVRGGLMGDIKFVAPQPQ